MVKLHSNALNAWMESVDFLSSRTFWWELDLKKKGQNRGLNIITVVKIVSCYLLNARGKGNCKSVLALWDGGAFGCYNGLSQVYEHEKPELDFWKANYSHLSLSVPLSSRQPDYVCHSKSPPKNTGKNFNLGWKI